MKVGWQGRKLSEVCQIIMGQSPDGSSYNVSGEGVPLINGPVEFSPFSFGKTLRTKFTTDPTKFCREGDLILCVRGSTTGRMNIAGFDACIGRGVAALHAPDCQHWINHFINWKRDEIHALGTGATFPNVSSTMVGDIQVNVPPLPEQQRIVAILDEAFAAIATAQANAEKNLQNCIALFNSRLDSIFLEPDRLWPLKRLSEVARDFGRGKSKHRPRNDPKLYEGPDGAYPFVQTGDVRNALHVIESFSQTYNEVGLRQSKLWPAGTLCITIAANIAETAILGFDACFPDSVIGLVPDETKANATYLKYLLEHYRDHLQSLGKGSAQANINLGTFENQVFPIPPMTDQRRIVSGLSAMQSKTQRLESIYRRKLAALDELKQSLLHQAFNGDL